MNVIADLYPNLSAIASVKRGAAELTQLMRGFRRHTLDDDAGRLNTTNEPSRFSEPNAGMLRVRSRKGLPVTRPLDGHSTLQFRFAPMPAMSKGIAADACRESRRPGNLTGDVRHSCAQRTVTIRLDNRAVMIFSDERLLGCPQSRADQNPIGTEHQCGGKTASISNAAGRQQQSIGCTGREKVRRLRN